MCTCVSELQEYHGLSWKEFDFIVLCVELNREYFSIPSSHYLLYSIYSTVRIGVFKVFIFIIECLK